MVREIKKMKDNKIQLLALDLDGTLFDTKGEITKPSVEAICKAQKQGVQVVLASGRDYEGMPWEQLRDIPIDYVITGNGSAVYATKGKERLYEECMDQQKLLPILEFILEKEVYMTIFLDGVHYTPMQCKPYVEHMNLPEYVKQWLRDYQNGLEEFMTHVREDDMRIQKVTLNFQSTSEGDYLNREIVKEYLEEKPEIHVVEGGFGNLEFTRTGINKASGLTFLANHLQIPMEQVMAIGDSENDIEMIETAGLGIAMGNALECVKKVAVSITDTNANEGVAKAIEKYLLNT